MKKILGKWNDIPLVARILVGLVLGAVLGLTVPQASVIGILGDVFVGALKAIAPILVFVLIISALANANGQIGSRFRTVIVLYLMTTLLASFLAVKTDKTINRSPASGGGFVYMLCGQKRSKCLCLRYNYISLSLADENFRNPLKCGR